LTTTPFSHSRPNQPPKYKHQLLYKHQLPEHLYHLDSADAARVLLKGGGFFRVEWATHFDRIWIAIIVLNNYFSDLIIIGLKEPTVSRISFQITL
jgi:hypothetical protein